MKLTSLRLINFRNYRAQSIAPCGGVTLFFGDNAQGKTNLLEAIALMSTGRSHRTRSDRDLILWGEKQADVRVRCAHAYAEHEVRMQLFPAARRQVLVNSAPITRTGELLGHVNAVLFAPEDLRLIKDGPQERRRFIDMELSQGAPGYYYALQRYNRILKQRNALLRSIPANPSQKHLLSTWDEQLCAVAPQIQAQRAAFVERLSALAAERHSDIASNAEELAVEYRPNPDPDAPADVPTLIAALERAQGDDIRRGSTSVGPHRDDLLIRIQSRDSRLYASQGQQRTAALALKLSELQLLREQTGECPILLLDDVMSELDAKRQRALLDHMRGVQTFVTAAVDSVALPAADHVYNVRGGEITSV
jgi:DNA replication and repair protein RecF